ncbi:MAG: heparan N-sulfatase, partial [Rikenellaceae bacterium]
MKNYNSLLKLSAICAPLVTACSTNKLADTDTKHPNIILFVADDHGRDALGCYGNPVVSTP